MVFQPFPVFGQTFGRALGQNGGGGVPIVSMASRIAALSGVVGYWKAGDPSGTAAVDSSSTGANGLYAGAYTLDQSGIGDGSRSTLFSGGRISLAAPIIPLNLVFNPLKGTLFSWLKVTSASVWTDSTLRVPFEIGADANNRVFFSKTSNNNRFDLFYNAGGTSKQIANTSFSPVGWFSAAITWDKGADQMKGFINGLQVGSTLTGLGVWVGALSSSFSALANFTSAGGANAHSGYIAHAVLANEVWSAAEIASIGIL